MRIINYNRIKEFFFFFDIKMLNNARYNNN